MPQPHLRTRSKKRLKVTLPSGRNTIRYEKGRASKLLCHICGQPLAGMPRVTTGEIHKLNRSKRRIWRPYGGNLCHNCLKTALKQAARTI